MSELLREVLADPADDGVRAVLADVLQAAGDPRGELIALQLLPADDNAIARQQRIRALLAEHGVDWLGALAAVVSAVRFERGFLSRLTLHPEEQDDGSPSYARIVEVRDRAAWAAYATSDALATVEDLVPGYVDGPAYATFVTSPALRSLRRVQVYDDASLAALVATPAPIAHVALPHDSEAYVAILTNGLRVLADLPNVTSLAIRASWFEAVLRAPWVERMRSLTVGAANVAHGLAWWPRIPRGCGLVVAPSVELDPCCTEFPWDFGVALAWEDGRLVARISGEWLLQPVTALAALPAEVTRIEVEQSSELIAQRICAAVARPGREVIAHRARRHGYLTLPLHRGPG